MRKDKHRVVEEAGVVDAERGSHSPKMILQIVNFEQENSMNWTVDDPTEFSHVYKDSRGKDARI